MRGDVSHAVAACQLKLEGALSCRGALCDVTYGLRLEFHPCTRVALPTPRPQLRGLDGLTLLVNVYPLGWTLLQIRLVPAGVKVGVKWVLVHLGPRLVTMGSQRPVKSASVCPPPLDHQG